MMIVDDMQAWMLAKRIVQMHRTAADDGKNRVDLVRHEKICDIICYALLHLLMPPCDMPQ